MTYNGPIGSIIRNVAPTTEVYGHGGINWGWYLKIEHVGERHCNIAKHWRIHYDDKNHPKTKGNFRLIEDEKPLANGWNSRNAIGVFIWDSEHPDDGVELVVLNPGYVFGYDGATVQPKMHGT